MTRHVAVLEGDGIGPEVARAAVQVMQAAVGDPAALEVGWHPFGWSAYEAGGEAFPDATRAACLAADAVFFGAVGAPGTLPPEVPRPERALLELRASLGTWANLRPVRPHPALLDASPLRRERVLGTDILFVRELTGGLYFGPKESHPDRASDTAEYSVGEIERVIRQAADLARGRSGRLTSVDKANVLATSRLWRQTTDRVIAEDYPDITLEHVLVDAMAMHLIARPATFDVVVTSNLFGDILTDEAAMLTGSLGMLPSASVGDGERGLYEPVHGTAPDIAGRGIANPYGAMRSMVWMLRLSLGLSEAADRLDQALDDAVAAGSHTPDLGGRATTADVVRDVLARLDER
ncbi:MAG: 3-isopropylmalate dehydrogenase [Myxococcales bacterium]|nr:3-isopropylmalate dehydrogenase [Myxococcales bacterium]